MEQYISDKKVLGVTIEETKTPGGQEMVKVLFENQVSEIMPKLRFDSIVTDKISDLTTVQNTIKDRVGKSLFSVMHEYGIKMNEVDGVLDQCTEFVNEGLRKSSDILFGCERPDITLNQVNNILLKQHAKENNDGTVSSGGGSDN